MSEDLIGKKIEEFKKDLPKFISMPDEYVFSLICYRYFYQEEDLTVSKIKKVFVDGRNDGGIDLVFVDESDERRKDLVLIQSKYVGNIPDKQDIVDMFTKISQTLNNFKKSQSSSYRKELKRALRSCLDEIEDADSSTSLVLFIGAEIEEKRKKEIEAHLKTVDELAEFDLQILYKKEIEAQILNVDSPLNYVLEDKISYEKSNGQLKYDDNGIIVNTFASSIRSLCEKYGDRGLFEQNFRYYIKQKQIDDKIMESINKKKKNFWFLNNGIIIGCEDFSVDGNVIKLSKFSIINGAQTSTLIGKANSIDNKENDFLLPCKIVKPKINTEYEDFISSIAEASNSQKPISDRDLKSTKLEQKQLRESLQESDPKIYLEIKRGQEKVSKRGREKWQFVRNDEYGQLILSFHFQKPGTARSNKKKIFTDEGVYRDVFKRYKFQKEGIVDLLKLNYFIAEYINKAESQGLFGDDEDSENVAFNGSLTLLAIVGFMIKEKRQMVDISKGSDLEKWSEELSAERLNGKLFSDYTKPDFQEKLESLLQLLINELSDCYKKSEAKSVTNMFKTDKVYYSEILKHIIKQLYKVARKKTELKDYLEIFE